MKIISFALKGAFVAGAISAGAFISGTALGMIINKEKVINKIKNMQLKKNSAASTK